MTDDQIDITPRAELLREAEELITGDRNNTYGTPTQNFTNIAALWNVQFAHLLKDGATFSPADVALAMIHIKMARMVAQPKRDNWVDLAGYAACGYETLAPAKEPQAMTGVVRPLASGGVFTHPYAPYTINVTTTGMDSTEVQAAVKAITEPITRAKGVGDHECGPAC